MNKTELSESLLKFYGMLKDPPKDRSYFSKMGYELSPTDFVVIGGGSLILQNILRETSDIDMMVRTEEKYQSLMKRVIQENIPIETKGLGENVASFRFSENKFDVLDRSAASLGLSSEPDAREKICVDGIEIYVRPCKLIAEDYNKALKELESVDIERVELTMVQRHIQERIRKYQERLKLLESHRRVASL